MTARRIAGALWGATIAFLGMLVLGVVLFAPAPTPNRAQDLIDIILVFGFSLSAGTVGAVVAARQPANPIGWTFAVMGLFVAVGTDVSIYADEALLTNPGSLRGGEIAAWLNAWLWVPMIIGGLLVLLLAFPDGRAPSPRWRRFGWMAAAALVPGTVASALKPGPLPGYPRYDNPFGVGGGVGEVFTAVEGASQALLLVVAPAVVAMVLRLRRSHGEERLQLTWFVYAGALVAIALTVMTIGDVTGVIRDPSLAYQVVSFAAVAGLIALPVAAGIAVLKYRLYEIDVIINRTLVYGALTATLAGAYLIGVLLLGFVVRPLTGSSNLAIAGSTLAVAALFGPARGRIQAIVDRRFYRRRYDAAQTLVSFGARLRDEVDLDALGADLRRVVSETMAPAHVSLWLRPVPAVTIPGRSPDTKEPR